MSYKLYYKKIDSDDERFSFVNDYNGDKVTIQFNGNIIHDIFILVNSIYVSVYYKEINEIDLMILLPISLEKIVYRINLEIHRIRKNDVKHISALENLIEFLNKELVS